MLYEDESRRIFENFRSFSSDIEKYGVSGFNTSEEISIWSKILYRREFIRSCSPQPYIERGYGDYIKKEEECSNIVPYGYIYVSVYLSSEGLLYYQGSPVFYFGQHKHTCFDRWYKGSGVIIRNYPIDRLYTCVLQWCYSREELDSTEHDWIKEFNAVDSPFFCNLQPGGYGRHFTTEQKLHLSKVRKMMIKENPDMLKPLLEGYKRFLLVYDHPNKGFRMSDEKKQFLSKTLSSLGRSDLMWFNDGKTEVFRKYGDVPEGFSKGRLNENVTCLYKSSLGRFWVTNGKVEISLSPGSRIPEGFHKGRLFRPMLESSKKKLSDTQKRPVICLDDGFIFQSVQEFRNTYNLSPSQARRYLHNHITFKDKRYMYKDEFDKEGPIEFKTLGKTSSKKVIGLDNDKVFMCISDFYNYMNYEVHCYKRLQDMQGKYYPDGSRYRIEKY